MQKLELKPLATGILYVLLSFISFYCCCYRLPVGVKYAVNLLVFGWAVLDFLLFPRLEDAKYCLRFFLLFSLSYLIPWVRSLLIWIADFASMGYIIRGSLNAFYMFTNFMYVGASYYLVGKKTMVYSLIGIALANGLVFVEVGMQYGFPVLLQEYLTLITTFAGKTGEVVRHLELHDTVYGWGVLLLYYSFQKTQVRWHRAVYLAISLFFFTLAFKRIAVFALALSLLAGWLMLHSSEKNRRRVVRVLFLLSIALAYLYIALIKSGVFYQIAEALKINLMGRKDIFSAYEDFYTLSPSFGGHGMRFVYQYGIAVNGIAALHNDLLGLYIEVGFITWFLWMWFEFSFRIHWVGQRYSYRAAAMLTACSAYLFILFMTDNTFYYFPNNVLIGMAVMAWCHEPENALHHAIASRAGKPVLRPKEV